MANVQLNLAPGSLSGVMVPGDGVTFTATSESGDWPASTALKVANSSGVEQSYAADVVTTLATWTLTAAQVTALVGTKTSGSLAARITTGTGDSLRPVSAGAISILSKWHGVRSAQSLGTVTLGPPGPGVASGVVDEDGALVLTLDNSTTLDPITLPPVVGLAIDADGDYYPAAGTNYVLTADADGDYTVREIA